jgi:hypothetical protein
VPRGRFGPPCSAGSGRPGFDTALLGTKGLSQRVNRMRKVVIVDSDSLLVFILLPLLVLALVIAFLLIQRARRRRDTGQ